MWFESGGHDHGQITFRLLWSFAVHSPFTVGRTYYIGPFKASDRSYGFEGALGKSLKILMDSLAEIVVNYWNKGVGGELDQIATKHHSLILHPLQLLSSLRNSKRCRGDPLECTSKKTCLKSDQKLAQNHIWTYRSSGKKGNILHLLNVTQWSFLRHLFSI